MPRYVLSHLSDDALLSALGRLVAQDRRTTAEILAHIAEVDARRLYAPAGYSSMYAYCVGELRLSEDAAAKRIQAARAARRAPATFDAVADGRLHLTGVCLLAPHITEENAGELIEAATYRSRSEIEALLLGRILTAASFEHAPGHVDDGGSRSGATAAGGEHAPGHVDGWDLDPLAGAASAQHAPGHVAGGGGSTGTGCTETSSIRVAISVRTHEKLRYAQALLSHAVPSGEVDQVLGRALDVLIAALERRKFGAGGGRKAAAAARPARPDRSDLSVAAVAGSARSVARPRYVPVAVRRAVWERDGGRCTFIGTRGHRCEEQRFLEFDHVEPVARGGRATVEGMRLRCRAHNQYEAERLFGAGFMSEKRLAARLGRGRSHARKAGADGRADAGIVAPMPAGPGTDVVTRDILSCLRNLGCRAEEARLAAARAAAAEGATFEDRLRIALRSIGPRRVGGASPAGAATATGAATAAGAAPTRAATAAGAATGGAESSYRPPM